MKLIVASKGWAESIPTWIIKEIKAERKKLKNSIGDAELCAYLYTASLKVQMVDRWCRIYMHVSHRLMKKMECKLPVPKYRLSSGEKVSLKLLKKQIYDLRNGNGEGISSMWNIPDLNDKYKVVEI